MKVKHFPPSQLTHKIRRSCDKDGPIKDSLCLSILLTPIEKGIHKVGGGPPLWMGVGRPMSYKESLLGPTS